MVLILTEISPDISWANDVAATCQMFFSSMSYSIKSYLIDNTNFWCLTFSMHYLTLATLLDYAVPVCTCEMFCFTGMMHVLPKIVLILLGGDSSSSHEKKKGGEVCIFS